MPKRSPLARFHAPVRAWFEGSFDAPTKVQALAWPAIASGASTLVLAPTGSGKTLAAFLAAIDRLSFEPPPEPSARCRVLYVSPLKALAVDVERNLRAPLAGIAAVARHAEGGEPLHEIAVEVRSGDTPAAARARIARHPPDILITTPESLYLLLTSQARAILASVDVIILDEIHALVPTKRGAHLAFSLERLEELRGAVRPGAPALQRIGLSATQRPLDEVARFLGGRDSEAPRPVTIVDASEEKAFDLRVEVPVDDMARLQDEEVIPSGPAAAGPSVRSIWPAIHPRLVELVRAHRSTILFVNSRRLAERLAQSLNDLAGEEIALAHHGSVAREKRSEIEERLKRGALPAIVATSSLELGIDMGAVDLVVQIEAPPSIASALQRVGRAGHSVGATSRGVIFPKHRGDLLPCAAVIARMKRGEVESTSYLRNPLDVLAQQIVATVAFHGKPRRKAAKTSKKSGKVTEPTSPPIAVDALFELATRAAPFAELPRSAFDGVLDMLSGRYPSDDFAELRPRITWDRVAGTVRARPNAARIAVVNGGTITDRGLYGVFLAGGDEGKGSRRVGELDEEMVFESRVGDVFLLGATSWRIEEITHDRVLVTPAPGEPGKMPFWHGDRPGRPAELGRAIGALARELSSMRPGDALARLEDLHGFDPRAAKNLVAYLEDEREAAGVLASDETIVIERFVDELGDHRVCVLSPLGARIHAPWATAVVAKLKAETGQEVDYLWSDDGIAFRLPESLLLDRNAAPDPSWFLPAADEIDRLVVDGAAATSLFSARFRECASRALLLPRRSPQRRSPLWMLRKRAADLLAVAVKHRGFPIVLETYRELLRDVFDLPGLGATLRAIEERRIRIATVDVRKPSPFAASLLFTWVASFLYDGDAPLAERRAHALSIDTAQLRELLGEAELRELLDPDVIDDHERALQRRPALDGSHLRAVRDADALHDLLLSIGDLSDEELVERAEADAPVAAWIEGLLAERRIFRLKIGGERRFAAAEDAARYRDALGLVPPPGLPTAFLDPVADAIGDLVSRFARTHGPFRSEDLATRFSLRPAMLLPTVERLVREGRIVAGEFLRGGRGREYVDAGVLRALRQKSLARLRKEIEPVEPVAYARFLPEWQGVRPKDRGAARATSDLLLSTIEQLQGAPIPASVLERDVLPARVPGYRAEDLDALCFAGEVVWAGLESIGPVTSGDGRIALYLAGHEPLLARPITPVDGELAEKIRALLSTRGALFFHEIVRGLGGFPGEILETVWSMVWAGEIGNDTLAPLRSRLRGERRRERGRPRVDLPGPRIASRLGAPIGSEGRWSLRRARLPIENAPSETERRTALARTLLERHGVLVREAVHAEGIAGGFGAVYDVLKAMEDAGRVRRGWFVAGLGAAQFALPGADDRLRAMREPAGAESPTESSARSGSDGSTTLVLAATDPANPWGAALSWPEVAGRTAKPQRSTGAHVVLHDGSLVAWLGRGASSILTFLPSEEPSKSKSARALAAALSRIAEDRAALLIAEVDGEPVDRHPIASFLRAVGFVAGARGYLKRRASPNRQGLASNASPTRRSAPVPDDPIPDRPPDDLADDLHAAYDDFDLDDQVDA
jgi:ATP-dependent Lhr-like helicase